MGNVRFMHALLVAGLAMFAAADHATAQTKGAGKIVCWKDKSGKVVGCGDTVPPEYRSSATTELDKRGVARKSVESEEEAARRRAQEKELAAQKAAEEKRSADQRRQDSALLATYANEHEVDIKRDRELKIVDAQIEQSRGALKNSEARLADAKSRKAEGEATRTSNEIENLRKAIAAKEKEREELRTNYAAQKKRYQELTGGVKSTPPPAPSAAPAAAKK